MSLENLKKHISQRESVLFLSILPLMLFLAYPDVCLGAKTFFYRDYKVFGYPLAHYLRSCFLSGTFPHWAPENFCGLPYFAQWNTLVLYPGSLLYIIFPPAFALPYFCLLHLCLGGWGMFRLARRWTGGNTWAASVAGLAFGFNGLALHFLMWPNNIAAYAWMPFAVDACDQVITQKNGRIVFAALMLALQFLCGAPEIIALTWIFIGLLAVVHLFPVSKHTFMGIGRLAASIALALSFTAVQLLPFLRLLKNSHRSSAFGESLAWSMPATGWANYIVPLFNTFAARQSVRWQPEQSWTSSYYPGIIIFALALSAIICIRNRKAVALSLGVLISLVFALGKFSFLYRSLLAIFPQFGFIRFPVKYVVLGIFCFPLLAAFSLNELTEPGALDSRRHLRRMLIGVCCGILLLAGILLHVNQYFLVPLEERTDTLLSGFTRMGLLMLGCGGVFLLSKRVTGYRKLVLRLLLLLTLGLDILTHMERQNPTVSVNPALLENLRDYREMSPVPKTGEHRALTSAKANHSLTWVFTEDLSNDALIIRLGLKNNTNLIEGIPKVGGFFSLYPKYVYDPLTLLCVPDLPPPGPFLDFLGVSQITSEENVYDWNYRSSARKILTAGQAPVYKSDQETLRAIFAKTFQPDEEVFLPVEARSVVGQFESTQAEVSDYTFTPTRIACSVETDAPTMLTLAQSYYPAWKVTIDDQPGKIWRANHGFQAVKVPAGKHRIVFEYKDRAFLLGGLISTLSWFGCIVYLVRCRKQKSGAEHACAAREAETGASNEGQPASDQPT